MDRALAIAGLSARAFVALLEIAREEPVSQQCLARRLGLRSSTTSELLRRLRRQGLVAAGHRYPATAEARQPAAGRAGGPTGGRDAGRAGGSAAGRAGRHAGARAVRLCPAASAGAEARGGRPPHPASLTPAGRAVLESAARIAEKLELAWALRLAPDPIREPWPCPPTARAYGLRRWLTESTAALGRTAAGSGEVPAGRAGTRSGS